MRNSWKKAGATDTHKQTPTVSDWMIILHCVNRLCHCGSGGVGGGGADGLYCLVCVAAEMRSVLSSQSK